MARNSSGTYSLPSGNPVVTNTKITSTWANNTMSDIANEITNSLDRNGRGRMAVPILQPDGSITLPSFSFINDPDTGMYLPAVGTLGLAIEGTTALAATTVGTSMPNLFPNRNRVINGGFLVNQYGTVTNTVPGSIKYGGVDRIFTLVTATTLNVSQSQAGALGAPAVSQKSLQLVLTSTGATAVTWATRLPAAEVADLNGRQITFSCVVSQGTGGAVNFTPQIAKANALDNFGAMTVLATGAAVSAPNSTATVVSMTTTLGASDATNGLQFRVDSASLGAQAGTGWFTTDWQVVIGPAVPAYPEFAGYASELLRCQRYYWQATPISTGLAFNTTQVFFTFLQPVQMRATPTFTAHDTTNRFVATAGVAAVAGTWAVDTISNVGVDASFTRGAGVWTTGQAVVLTYNTASDFPFSLSAEL